MNSLQTDTRFTDPFCTGCRWYHSQLQGAGVNVINQHVQQQRQYSSWAVRRRYNFGASLSSLKTAARVAEHYFCKTCGIYTHHKRRSNPNQYGINIACIEGVDPYSYKDVPIGNGDLNAPLPAKA